MLLAAIVPDDETTALTPLAAPATVGADAELEVGSRGTLYVRINDLPSELSDNRGSLQIHVAPIPARPD